MTDRTLSTITDAEAQTLTIAGLREALGIIQDYRLTWAMACHCSCQACEIFYESIRDIEDGVALNPSPLLSEADHVPDCITTEIPVNARINIPGWDGTAEAIIKEREGDEDERP